MWHTECVLSSPTTSSPSSHHLSLCLWLSVPYVHTTYCLGALLLSHNPLRLGAYQLVIYVCSQSRQGYLLVTYDNIPYPPWQKTGLLQQNRIKTGLLSFNKSGIKLLPKTGLKWRHWWDYLQVVPQPLWWWKFELNNPRWKAKICVTLIAILCYLEAIFDYSYLIIFYALWL